MKYWFDLIPKNIFYLGNYFRNFSSLSIKFKLVSSQWDSKKNSNHFLSNSKWLEPQIISRNKFQHEWFFLVTFTQIAKLNKNNKHFEPTKAIWRVISLKNDSIFIEAYFL